MSAGCSSTSDKAAAPGTDAAYVSGFCKTMLTASAEAGKVAPSGPSTQQDFTKLSAIYSDAADSLQKLDTPANVSASNDLVVRDLREVAADLESGNQQADPFAAIEQLKFPTEIGKRLQAVASDDPDCVKLGAHFDQNPLG